MVACVSITVSSPASTQSQEFKFFEADSWSPDNENLLLGGIKEIFNNVGAYCQSINVVIAIESSNADEICFQLRKKINNISPITTSSLSIREIEILGLIMQGLTNNEIAEKLFISYETVKSHRKHILEKTGAKNTAALINYYHRTFFEK